MVRPRSEFTEEEIARAVQHQFYVELLDYHSLLIKYVFNTIEQGGFHPSELIYTLN